MCNDTEPVSSLAFLLASKCALSSVRSAYDQYHDERLFKMGLTLYTVFC